MKVVYKLAAATILASMLTGCGSLSYVNTMNAQTKKMAEQAHVVQGFYGKPQYRTSEGMLQVPAVISEVNVVEAEKPRGYGQGIAASFGRIARLGGVVADQNVGKETISVNEYVLVTQDGQSFVVPQATGDDFDQDLVKGERVVFQSSKPLDEGGNVFYITRH